MKAWQWVAVALLAILLLGGAAVVLGTGYKAGKPFEVRLKSIGGGQFLEEKAADGWLAMVAAARAEGLDLHTSGSGAAFRSPEQQQELLGTRGAYGAGGYAAQVGFSPHQSGCAVDVANVSPGTPNFDGALSAWLSDNCGRFGWARVGLSFKTVEPWHLEFFKSVTNPAAIS